MHGMAASGGIAAAARQHAAAVSAGWYETVINTRGRRPSMLAAIASASSAKAPLSTSSFSPSSLLPATESTERALVSPYEASGRYPTRVLALPLLRRPLLPGILTPVTVSAREVGEEGIAALDAMRREEAVAGASQDLDPHGGAFIGAFLHKTGGRAGVSDGEADDEAGIASRPLRFDDMYDVGTFAQVHFGSRPSGDKRSMQLLLMGHRRIRKLISSGGTGKAAVGSEAGGALTVLIQHLKDENYEKTDVLKATAMEVVSTIKELLQLNPMHKEQLSYIVQHRDFDSDASRLADLAAALTTSGIGSVGEQHGGNQSSQFGAHGDLRSDLQAILEELNVQRRLEASLLLLKKELELARLQSDIGKRVEEKISAQQRKYFLHEQLKSIKKELGMEKDEKAALSEKFKERFDEVRGSASDQVVKVVDEEITKLSMLDPSGSEFSVTRNYLDWLTSIRWGVVKEEALSLGRAQGVLDEDHYGLEDVKERILEFIAVRSLRGEGVGKILLLVGPPGVGKTSIARSVARALNREYYRFSVGGLSDVAEIRGHRRTYVGAMPGKPVQCLKTVKCVNPLVLIDEIDKLGRGGYSRSGGDPSSALLELLDPEQNGSFLDHYLDVDIDFSNVLFMCTANDIEGISAPLLDRMEVIRLSGYLNEEKTAIARRYLEPSALRETGLTSDQVHITDEALSEIIENYCREPGVRNLQKSIERLYRKAALTVVRQRDAGEAEGADAVTVRPANLLDMIGPASFSSDKIYDSDRPVVGVVVGLAYTPMGGAALYIESSATADVKGGGLTMTGHLGEVMKESAALAKVVARRKLHSMKQAGGESTGAPDTFFDTNHIHIHVPAGATPKDGPSAGITMATSMLSLATGRCVRTDLAMTGEVTLNGMVLPVGGVKEKALAAKRAGLKTLLLPEGNRQTFDQLPEQVKADLIVQFCSTFDDVVNHAFE